MALELWSMIIFIWLYQAPFNFMIFVLILVCCHIYCHSWTTLVTVTTIGTSEGIVVADLGIVVKFRYHSLCNEIDDMWKTKNMTVDGIETNVGMFLLETVVLAWPICTALWQCTQPLCYVHCLDAICTALMLCALPYAVHTASCCVHCLLLCSQLLAMLLLVYIPVACSLKSPVYSLWTSASHSLSF